MHDNTITLKTEHQDEVVFWLDAAAGRPRPAGVVERDGRRETFPPRPSPETFCEGLEERGDPRLAAPVRIKSRPPAVTGVPHLNSGKVGGPSVPLDGGDSRGRIVYDVRVSRRKPWDVRRRGAHDSARSSGRSRPASVDRTCLNSA